MAQISLRGSPCNTNGELPVVGSRAPDFCLTNGKLIDVNLDTYSGKKKILNIVPSLDTPVCAKSTKIFNERVAGRDDVVMLIVSADLPFSQGRFCQTEGANNVEALSLMRDKSFARDYGVLITDGPFAGITARAVVVIDANNDIVYTQLVAEIADEPDYEAAMAAVA